ncbi:hypothetical protein BX661DRAFT_96108 [Kickxella alabastrina]|uniref:uncharacterized protein n=1 Tax=Kickxella alabastrina TaxID=61397 RepID=UPI002220B43F|nr:uncharacterized protein BX661DRAFT_96108 [Kickxella alabastrina]KAI7829995.1 hypothetical protein BX661DRAFT_96108 [Kickxella alabastrina]
MISPKLSRRESETNTNDGSGSDNDNDNDNNSPSKRFKAELSRMNNNNNNGRSSPPVSILKDGPILKSASQTPPMTVARAASPSEDASASHAQPTCACSISPRTSAWPHLRASTPSPCPTYPRKPALSDSTWAPYPPSKKCP